MGNNANRLPWSERLILTHAEKNQENLCVQGTDRSYTPTDFGSLIEPASQWLVWFGFLFLQTKCIDSKTARSCGCLIMGRKCYCFKYAGFTHLLEQLLFMNI